MTEAKHTPGPWRVQIGTRYTQIACANGGSVATVCRRATRGDMLLLAAAPDMLFAHDENARLLGILLNELQGRVDAGKLEAIARCLDRSKDAIAKATGES